MNIRTATSLAMGMAILLGCYFGYLGYVKNVGYPDGHITDYDGLMSLTFKIMILPLLALSLYAFYLAINSTTTNTAKQLKKCGFLVLVGLAIFSGLDLFAYHSFDHGQGG